jgi:lysozyme
MAPSPKVVDLSHYDTVTSFEDLYNAGILGVIHKATEGATYIDETYTERQAEAAKTPLLWGAYHFYQPADSPQSQAGNFLAVAKDVERWFLDYEVQSNPADIMAVMQLIKAGCSGKMGLYGPKDLIVAMIAASNSEQEAFFAECDLWWAEPDIDAPEGWPAEVWPKWFLWQYTWTGTIAGVSGESDTDLNAFNGTDADLIAQWGGA